MHSNTEAPFGCGKHASLASRACFGHLCWLQRFQGIWHFTEAGGNLALYVAKASHPLLCFKEEEILKSQHSMLHSGFLRAGTTNRVEPCNIVSLWLASLWLNISLWLNTPLVLAAGPALLMGQQGDQPRESWERTMWGESHWVGGIPSPNRQSYIKWVSYIFTQ